MTRDPRIDDYIAKAAPFARPILEHLRGVVHAAFPQVEEGIKWGMPHFMLGGKNLAGMAAFKAHAAFVVHGEDRQSEGMGSYGKIASLADLPDERAMRQRLADAADRLAAGPQPGQPRQPKPEIAVPDDFLAALGDKARATFDAFAPSHRREYLAWITEAKRPETRARRIAQAAEWLAEGKKRNWKHEGC